MKKRIKSSDSLFIIFDSRGGFSLLELLIYIAILTIATLIVAGTFLSISRGGSQAEARSDVNDNLRFAVEKMSQDVRAASSVTTPAAAGATATSLVMTVSGATVTYDVLNSELRRQVSGGSTESITSNTVKVGTTTFTRLENTNAILGKTIVSVAIDTTMSASTTNPGAEYTASKKTTASMR